MLSFLKRIFGAKPAETTSAPYKVENTVPQVAEFPFPKTQQEKKPSKVKKSLAKKPAVKKSNKSKIQE
jgi:hypothetical protein